MIDVVKDKILSLSLVAMALILAGCSGIGIAGFGQGAPDSYPKCLIRVNVTRQGYNFHRPWEQGSPSTHTAVGVIVDDNRVLLTAEMMAGYRYVELEKLGAGNKGPAEVEVIDYDANLALIRAKDPAFLEPMEPLQLTADAVAGDHLTVLQVKGNGDIAPSRSPITSVELILNPFGSYFLTYRLNGSLQYRYNNFTLPALKEGRLAGLLTGYDAKAQTIDILSAPIIEHFIREASTGRYHGFPRLGVQVVPTDDPQLRRYVGIPEDLGGVYVQEVAGETGGTDGGLKVGDIITEMDGHAVDEQGNYRHPLFGSISIAHLLRSEFYAGDRIKVGVFREGKILNIEAVPEVKTPEDFIVPPYVVDSAPRYFILAGLVFGELSLPYLKEYGPQWPVNAPIGLVYYQKNQHIPAERGREKIVLISHVLGTSQNIGYEGLSDLVVTRVNQRPISRLEDVAEAIRSPVDGFHKIELEEHPKVLFIDPGEVEDINTQIKQRYGIPQLHNLAGY